MITQIYHKKNELFEVEFYKDKECTQYIEKITGEDIYIELQNGDISPLMVLESGIASVCTIYTPFISKNIHIYSNNGNTFETLNGITPNLSKYIPEDNAVLFLTQNDFDNYRGNLDPSRLFIWDKKDGLTEDCIRQCSKITIFIHHGTQSELFEARDVAKELKEKYGVEEVNFVTLHCFMDIQWHKYIEDINTEQKIIALHIYCVVNKIITTNSTGILRVQKSDRLQVINCKEFFEEYLKEKNN